MTVDAVGRSRRRRKTVATMLCGLERWARRTVRTGLSGESFPFDSLFRGRTSAGAWRHLTIISDRLHLRRWSVRFGRKILRVNGGLMPRVRTRQRHIATCGEFSIPRDPVTSYGRHPGGKIVPNGAFRSPRGQQRVCGGKILDHAAADHRPASIFDCQLHRFGIYDVPIGCLHQEL